MPKSSDVILPLQLVKMKLFAPACEDIEQLTDGLNDFLPGYGISTGIRVCCFLAQMSHESAGFTKLEENLNYSSIRLREVFPTRVSLKQAVQVAKDPEKTANLIYANRMGNGDALSGDGWKYRGRGIIHLTGKSNYYIFGQRIGVDLVKHPDLAKEIPNAIHIACCYWIDNECNVLADQNDMANITRKINGGLNGLTDRTTRLKIAKRIFDVRG